MNKDKKERRKYLKQIAKSLPVLMWEEMIGTKPMSGVDVKKFYDDNKEDSSWVDVDEKYMQPIIGKKEISWNTHLRRLETEFKKHGEQGVKLYIQDAKDLHAQHLTKYPFYYHLADFDKYDKLEKTRASDKNKNKALVDAVKSTLTYNIVQMFNK